MLTLVACSAQARQQWEAARPASEGRAPLRNEFMSYETRPLAEAYDRTKLAYYRELTFERLADGNLVAWVELPFDWLGREVFLHVEGVAKFEATVNGRFKGRSQDSRTPSEFDVSQLVRDGGNKIELAVDSSDATMEPARSEPLRCFIYAQPRVRIEDYRITTLPDGKRIMIDVAVRNDNRTEERLSVGYDIYSPDGTRLHYDLRETSLAPGGADTVHFADDVPDALANLWSPAAPRLYKTTLYIKNRGRAIEYVPLRVGFATTGMENGRITVNHKPLELNMARYNSAPTEKQTAADLKRLKSAGRNALWVDYPQPFWFYDLCDAIGLYVIDQANIHCEAHADRSGAVNDPRLTNFFTERVEAAYRRSASHVCIVAWSLGGACGNGYNMYNAYRRLKALGDPRPTLYPDAAGEWNTDCALQRP